MPADLPADTSKANGSAKVKLAKVNKKNRERILMTTGQFIAMCIIGAVALMAYLQSYEVARALKMSLPGQVPMQA
jgi:hypothetical protein